MCVVKCNGSVRTGTRGAAVWTRVVVNYIIVGEKSGRVKTSLHYRLEHVHEANTVKLNIVYFPKATHTYTGINLVLQRLVENECMATSRTEKDEESDATRWRCDLHRFSWSRESAS